MILKSITGKVLIERGYETGAWFGQAIPEAEKMRAQGADWTAIDARLKQMMPAPPVPMRDRSQSSGYSLNIQSENDGDDDNIAKVTVHMEELMRVPTVVLGTVLPDACPSGRELGTIPVGGVIATREAIHPGFHSADICCSVAITLIDTNGVSAKEVLDRGQAVTHFGGGGRPRGQQWIPPADLMSGFEANTWLNSAAIKSAARDYFGTQGDGNHFLYVGHLKSDPTLIALVTHHGSRGPGAMLYKAGMAWAQKNTRKIAPEVPTWNAWIPSESVEGESYWQALQLIRQWTKDNHFAIHDKVLEGQPWRRTHRFWNEHNFVFRRDDGLFYHAKGATPGFVGWAGDASGQTLVPLNMREPILITEGSDNSTALGFLPHGAGRNLSRSDFLRANLEGKTAEQLFAEQTVGIDARSFCGYVDASELPGAYKDASSVRRQIEHFKLATIVDEIEPYGSIMAGDWQRDAPWRKGKGRGNKGAMHRGKS